MGKLGQHPLIEKISNSPALALLILVLFGAILFGIFLLTQNTKVQEAPPANLDEFAQCLKDNGAAMYGAEWCSHCQEQKRMFADAFANITFVDCEKRQDACTIANITAYPTWVINGNHYLGVQQYSTLSMLTGCKLE